MFAAAAAVAATGGLLRAWRAEAARQDGGPVSNASDPRTPDSVNIDGDLGVSAAQGRPSGPVRVFVELNEAPTTQVYADVLEKSKASLSRPAAEAVANKAAQEQLSAVKREQSAMAARLTSSFGVKEMYRTQRVLNGIAVTADAAQVEALRAAPGVKAVLNIPEHFPTNATSVPFIKAPQLWDNSLGIKPDLTGRNIKLGIIDTGIDYLHGDFGGSGALADYTANNRTTNADGYFPTAKVVGGFDFAGDAYNASNTPMPDPDPMDCNGHGTHVAGTAAGLGVLATGASFNGPYGVGTPFGAMRIGPGVAPGASLYALRVFGCAGGTFLTTQAIEWSVDPNADGDFSDRLDVINMSLGGTYGNDTDASAAASNNAVLAGVIVVTSAGNDADTYFIHGSPGTAKRAISTAASSDNGQGTGPILRINSAPTAPALVGTKTAAVQRAWGPGPSGQTANVVTVVDGVTNGQPSGPTPNPTPVADTSSGTTTDACQPLTPASAQAVRGKIALADRGLCSVKTKTVNVQNAGAIALIVNNNNTTDTTPPVFADDPNIHDNIVIPTVTVLKQDGDAIKSQPPDSVNVTLLSMADTIAGFSSRGPRRQPLGLKPDITAPGLSIVSAQTGTTCPAGPNTCQTPNPTGFLPGNQSLLLQGTSMAAPHIAGLMAILRQLHPDWTVEELKALAMNGAVSDIFTLPNGAGTRYGLSRVGAGRADAVRSASNTAVAYDATDTGAVSVSGFDNEVVGSVSGRSRTIRVVNKGTTDVTYTLGLDTVNDAPGVSFSLPDGNTLTVPAGQARTFRVAMNAVADQMDHAREPSVATTQLGNGRHFLTEEGAYVTFTANSQVQMRVPVYVSPRPASLMEATDTLVTGAATSGQTALALSGQDVCTGTRPGGAPDCAGSFPTDVVSLVTPFELQAVSPAKGGVPAHADLRHVGVSSDGTNIYFGLSSYGDWTWPSDVEFDIFIDTNEDGIYERVAFNTFLTSNAQGVRGTDVFVTAVLNNQTGAQTGLTFLNGFGGNSLDTAIYNNNTMVMVVPISSLGFATGDTSFRYRIDVFDWNLSGRTDDVGRGTFGGANSPLTFNYAAPGLNFPATPSAVTTSAIMFADMDGRTIPTNFNKTNLTANRSLGGLLLHHHNARGTRAEVFAVQGTSAATTDIGVGVTVNNPNPALNANVNITVTATNVSSNNATGVSVLDQLPAGLNFVSATPSVGTYNPATGIWTIGALNAGQSATLQIVAAVKTTDPMSNTARVASSDQLDINPANDQASAAVTAPRTADLGVTLSASASNANPGQSVTYTVTVTNAGEDTANNVVVNLAFSPAATVTSATPSSGVFNTATGVWNVAGLGKGGTATLTVTVTVPSVCGDLTATATIASADTADPNSVNNSATATLAVGPAATAQFDQATYVVQEDSTAVNVVVTRTGDPALPFTVNYTTADGTASSRSDYNTAVGKLSFAAGETSKTIPVLINEDSHVEGAETFTITLSNPSVCQAALGAQSSATIQINDDATEPSTNPIDDSTNFVRQHYHDFLNREPDAPGLAFWVGGIESCGANAGCREAKRIDTSAAFFLSIEFQGTGGFVYHAYTAAFGPTRIGGTVPLTIQEFLPDAQQVGNGVIIGEAGAEARLEANKRAYLLEFVQRPEFLAQYPNSMTPEQFVDALNANTGNSLTQAERDDLVAQLSANNTAQGRADVLREVIDNAAFQARERNRAFVLMQYFGYLRRNPNDPPDSDFSGYNFWLNKLNQFNGDFRAAEMVKAFITSIEYRSRFGQN
ncbi:MAG TPA: S8 family serine peptidase [Pyrinomonadaceae bacterium]|nr:S8 family serine peptidase [Pyrinomonadaceae bacterium]